MNEQNSFEAMLAIISSIRDARTRPAVVATVETTHDGGRRSVAKAWVDFNDRIWSLTEENVESAFHPESGWTISSDGVVETVPRERDDWMPEGMRMFFPLSLRIWGGRMDDWRVIDAEVKEGDAHLSFQHKEEADLFGQATIDLRWGIATEFTMPWERTKLEGIKNSWG
ncbi:hypothetical protein IV498_09640 [Paenarthrobacter sp. Z7-10]|uniref:hypothetical protein n=1 Tax=Paenarthrobacter sp. Z7-10 TaxID=2787635 RepID=UPI0022A8E171|nr:hypothetical protein [Paenarthrobacter sp. Z7-10]MCZ2403437.1 hypothetical protein [Paenarthrobacter sp. Z7-10]